MTQSPPEPRSSDVDHVGELIDQQPPAVVAEMIEEMVPADAAETLGQLEVEHAAQVAEFLDPDTASDVLSHLDADAAAEIVAAMESVEASMVLERMDPDDRTDVIGLVDTPLHDELLEAMAPEDAEEVRQLEQYPPETAGGIMTPDVTALQEHLTVDEAIANLRRMSEELEQINYVYVTDEREHLLGVLSMRDLILARPERRLGTIMIEDVHRVSVNTDQEEVAQTMQRYDYLAMPVVDDRNRLIGVITVDDVVDVIEAEATEDVQRLFGAGAEERLNSSWWLSFRKRVWWLEVNLATAFCAAAVVAAFDETIGKLALLAAYMPVVAGMGGNAGAQAMAVTVRGLATGVVDRKTLRAALIKEALVGVATGAVVGTTTAILATIFHYGSSGAAAVWLGLVVAAALLINHTLACVTGAGIPFLMKRLGFDPAQSATIFATTITDVVGFLALLGLAFLMMNQLTS